MEKFEVGIIGAGPAGLSAALYLARAGRHIIIVDKGAPGGKLLTLNEIANYPGVPSTSGFALATSFVRSASDAGVEVTYDNIMSVRRSSSSSFIVTGDALEFECDALIVGTGLSFVPTIPGEKEFLGHGVSYCATCDGRLYKGKAMGVYGVGERALEEALYLAPLASELHYFVPDEFLTESPYASSLRSMKNVIIHKNSKVTRISGTKKVEMVEYKENNEDKKVALSALFPLFGEKSASSFLSPLSLSLNRGFIPVENDMSVSSCPGLFGIGDIIVKDLRQVVTAASDGAISSNSVLKYLNKRKKENA